MYYQEVIEGLFPGAIEIDDSGWGEKKISFKLKKLEKVAGSVGVDITPELRKKMKKHFGENWKLSIEGYVRDNTQNKIEIIQKVTLSNLNLASRPKP